MPSRDARVSALARLARGSPPPATAAMKPCELCGEPIAPDHRHVVDRRARVLRCVCRGCTVLLERPGAGGAHLRLVPQRRLVLDPFDLDDATWAALQVPVDIAFFFHSTPAGRVIAVYPGAAGATESQLALEAWADLEARNPVLETLEPDVEALLVDRSRGGGDHYLVPIDECYALAGVIRTHWRGLGGGDVWRHLDTFFDHLHEEAQWRT
jgi:hypothetical protein